MIYLVDPKKFSDPGRCPGVFYPLYGIPPEPCNSVCSLFVPCKTLL